MIQVTLIKGALNFLKNNIQCITDTGQAVLELLWSKVATGNPHRSRKLSFSDLSTIGAKKNRTVNHLFLVIS